MIDKLKEIITHFESLEKQMADPVLTNNQNRYVEVTKEHRYLSPIIAVSYTHLTLPTSDLV